MGKRASILNQKEGFFKPSAREVPHPVDSFVGPAQGQAVLLPVDSIRPSPNQPRKTFSEESIASLAASIQEKGLLQPISVRKDEDGFVLVVGERRWRAHQTAGIKKIRAFITNVEDPNEAFELALVENLQREDLHPLEEAAGIAELMRRKGYRQKQAAGVVGRSEPQVSQLLKLDRMPEEVKTKVSTSKLSRDQLFQIAAQETPEAMLRLLDKIARFGLDVRGTRKAARGEGVEKRPHPLIGKLKRFEKALIKARLDEIDLLSDEDRKAASALLEAIRGEIEQTQQRLRNGDLGVD